MRPLRAAGDDHRFDIAGGTGADGAPILAAYHLTLRLPPNSPPEAPSRKVKVKERKSKARQLLADREIG